MTASFEHIGMLGFDVFGTVVDWRTSVARACEPFLRKHGIDADPLAFADAWRAQYQPSMEEVRSHRRPWVKLDILTLENLQMVLVQHGVRAEDIPFIALEDLNRCWEKLDPWPDSVEGLLRLKQRYAIAPISNGHIAGMLRLARHGRLPWDVILGAEIAHAYKPQPAVYLASCEAAGLAPPEVCMVAAHNSDLVAARALGLHTVFLRRPREHGPQQSTDLAPDHAWDVVVESMLDVADALGC